MSKDEDKETADLEAGSIKSSASVKKILQQLVVRNQFAYEVWGMVCGRRRPPRYGAHHALLAHTQHAPEAPPGLPPAPPALQLPYRASLMAPLRQPTPAPLHLPDPITQPYEEIEEWYKGLATMHSQSRSQDWQITEASADVWVCAAGVTAAARHLASRPHRHLASSAAASPHNFLWAGGGTLLTLELPAVPTRAVALVRHTTLGVYAWPTQDEIGEPLCTYECGEQALELTSACGLTLAVRTAHAVHILRLTQQPHVTLTIRKVIQDPDVLFTAINLDPYHNNILYISLIDGAKIFCDLDTIKYRRCPPEENVSITGNWNPVIGYDRHHYIRASRYKLRVYRKQNDAEVYSYDVRAVCDVCNVITLVRRCEGSPLLFVGTTHHLLCVDMRALPGRGPRALAKWTHGLESPPVYIATAPYVGPGHQLVCIGSQRAGELCLVAVDAAQLSLARPPKFSIFPYHPPAPHNTLDTARLRAQLLDLSSADVAKRLRTCTAGLTMSKTETGYKILVLNSLGDLMGQELVPENMAECLSDSSVERLVRWAESFSVEPKVWDVTRMYDFSEFWSAQLLRKAGELGPPQQKRRDTRAVSRECMARELREDTAAKDFDVALLKIWNFPEPDLNLSNADADEDSTAESAMSGISERVATLIVDVE